MGRKRRPREAKRTYKCEDFPCIHVVIDDRRKRFKVFIEDYVEPIDEAYIIPVSASRLAEACEELDRILAEGYREAEGEEIDELARKYLGARVLGEE